MRGRPNPPEATRFQKGKSGNPNGRPRKSAAAPASAFDVILDRTLTVTQGGQTRSLSVDEALQQKTYQDALAGNRAATREVLKWIQQREKARAKEKPPRTTYRFEHESIDPDNADAAMLLLGIAAVADPNHARPDEPPWIKLEPWAVQLTLSRPGKQRPDEKDVREIERCTRAPETLRFPRSIKR